MLHVELSTLKQQLQERMNYPLTREEAGNNLHTLDEAFEILLSGFGAWLTRRGLGTVALVAQCKQRGWMTQRTADLFLDYSKPLCE